MAMAFYAHEEEVWKCPNHPSKHRRNGICPICLCDRLITLCPDCANVRPCACSNATTTSSSSASSSSFLSSATGGNPGRMSNLVDGESASREWRSVAIPFLRSRFAAGDRDSSGNKPPSPASRSKLSLLSAFRTHKNKKREDEEASQNDAVTKNDYAQRMMMRSRSVSVPVTSRSVAGSSASKGRSWYFPSPIKVFRQSKTSKVVQERSPLCRG
ncbi:uncharacterized protein LOC130766465 [Actinidia eriantha]|uniref:uncharacterized protein LOC130766465 n=1 Tax=Actinidia eriantha TaxID=165200 RepID=UPI00258CB79A|nr:uncharacterized protein LOC130766465 [Actinidia eriantha]